MMNTILSDLIGKNVYAYLDDVIMFNKDPESHFTTLMEVFVRLKNAGLKAKLTKCEFLKEHIRLTMPVFKLWMTKSKQLKISCHPRAPTRFAYSSGCVGITVCL